MREMNLSDYLDKVHGCWAGKNIGGTLGAPFEGQRDIREVEFYTQALNDAPAPNDDLDLQLIWLGAVESQGLENITPRILGEYWSHIIAPCSEYSIARFNISRGFFPPLSGACNNDTFKYSNGAWIRSEIWACFCPGAPDEAVRYAYMDACIDHCEEGIYAEMFTAALQSAAFIESDYLRLIAIALSKIPDASRVAQAVKLVVTCRAKGCSWRETREAVVADSTDLGWFQAPGNVAFVIIGLLYGQGDFGKSICIAVNCGDDTDCTGATLGALLGILHGYRALPEKWLKPIGNSIQVICLNMFGFFGLHGLPRTIDVLTERVVQAACAAAGGNALLLKLTPDKTSVDAEYLQKLDSTTEAARIWRLPLHYLDFVLPYANIRIVYENGPVHLTGDTCNIMIEMDGIIPVEAEFSFRWRLPETWLVEPAAVRMLTRNDCSSTCRQKITIGNFKDIFEYPELEVTYEGRAGTEIRQVPIQKAGCTEYKRFNTEGEKPRRIRQKHERAAAESITFKG